MARLREGLAPLNACAVDASGPEYRPYQQLKDAQLGHDAFVGDILVFVVWKPPTKFVKVGSAWWDFGTYETDSEGYANPVLPIGAGLHHWLFRESEFLQHLTLRFQRQSNPLDRLGAGENEEAIEWADEQGLDVLFVEGCHWTARSRNPFGNGEAPHREFLCLRLRSWPRAGGFHI